MSWPGGVAAMEKKPGIKLSETSGNGQRGDATWGNDVFDAKNSDFQTSRAVSIWELLGPVANKSTSEQIGKLLLIVTFSQRSVRDFFTHQKRSGCTCHTLDNTIALTEMRKDTGRRTKMVTATGMLFALPLAIFSNI